MLLQLLALTLIIYQALALAEPGELLHHHSAAGSYQQQGISSASEGNSRQTVPRRLLADHDTSLLTSPVPGMRFPLLHRPSDGQPATLVNFTVTPGAPVTGSKDLPLLFLLNGANVEAEQYSQLAAQLSLRGYTFVGSDLYQPLPPLMAAAIASRQVRRRGTCPPNKILSASAGLIPTFLAWARNSSLPAVQDISRRGIVLVSHSLGGVTALNLLTGVCARSPPNFGVDTCGQPQQRPGVRSVSATSATCTANRTQQQLEKDLVLGVVTFEGYFSNRSTNGSLSAVPMEIPPGTFVLFMAGQYNDNTRTAWNLTKSPRCSCAGLASFPGLSHFGINNWQGPGTNQVTPCAVPGSSDPANFTVSEQLQRGALQQQAQLIDDFVRAAALRQRVARQRLEVQAASRLPRQPAPAVGAATSANGSTASSAAAPSQAVGRMSGQQRGAYVLHLKGSCF